MASFRWRGLWGRKEKPEPGEDDPGRLLDGSPGVPGPIGYMLIILILVSVTAVFALNLTDNTKRRYADPVRSPTVSRTSTLSPGLSSTGTFPAPGLSTPAPDPSETGSSAAPTPSAAGRPLTLMDSFDLRGDWVDGRFDVDGRFSLTGIGTVVDTCIPQLAPEIQFHFASKFTFFKMSVGQANASAASDRILVVDAIANGRKIRSERIAFNSLYAFEVPITNVNQFALNIYLENCDELQTSTVTAVIHQSVVS